jgi:hypothetical protein
MQQMMNESMQILGIIMAVVCDHQSDKSTPSFQHDVPMAFCITGDMDANNPTVTLEMLQLGWRGYSQVAIVRFDSNMPDQFHVFTPRDLPVCVQLALLKKAECLINDAFSRSTGEYN